MYNAYEHICFCHLLPFFPSALSLSLSLSLPLTLSVIIQKINKRINFWRLTFVRTVDG
jgi:hypothetical protein